MPENTIEETEVENVPFTQYSKSVTFTFLQMAASFGLGCRGVTMNLFDHCGTPMESHPVMGRMLRKKKRFLDALAERAQRPGALRGVRMLFHPREAYHRRLPPGAGASALIADGYPMVLALETHGIPVAYGASETAVAATSGQTLCAFTDEEIADLLKRGLLLDAVAANTLFERGFGPQLGLQGIEPPVPRSELGPIAAEELFHPEFGGAPQRYLTASLPGLSRRVHVSRMDPADGATVVSRLVDPDQEPGAVALHVFENALGGRVAVQAYDLATAYGPGYCHPLRAEQLRRVLLWLSRGQLPLAIHGPGAHPLGMRHDATGETLLGFFNLTLDAWDEVTFDLFDEREPARLERLSRRGRWKETSKLSAQRREGRLRVTHQAKATHAAPLFVAVAWK